MWMAYHDNGWTTTVRENVDGTFSAAAEPPGESVTADYVEGSPETGKAAAEYALKRKTGHVCRRSCKTAEIWTDVDETASA